MKSNNLEDINSDEDVLNLLNKYGLFNINKKCPYCGSTETYEIRRNHLKCKKCRREWSKYKGTILENVRIKPLKLFQILECLAEGKRLKLISNELKVSYNTVLKVRNKIMKKIIKIVFDIEIEKDIAIIGFREQKGKLIHKKIDNLSYSEIPNENVDKIIRTYIIINYLDYDFILIITNKTILELDSKIENKNLKLIKQEIHEIRKIVLERISKGKLINSNTLLYNLAQIKIFKNEGKFSFIDIILKSLKPEII